MFRYVEKNSFFIFKNFLKKNFFFSKILNFVAPDSFLKTTAAAHDVITTIVSHAAVATLFISASIVHSSYFACSCPFHKASLPCIQDLRLVGQTKCLLQITRENILSLGKQSLAAS
jgi:hypothetical protein